MTKLHELVPVATAPSTIKLIEAARTSAVWPPKNIEEWLEYVDSLPDPEWIIQDLIPYDATVIISGAPKRAFKTWFAFWLGLCIASGESLLESFVPTSALNVLVIELEGPAKQTANRWRWLAKGLNIQMPRDHLFMLHRYPILLDSDDWISKLSAYVQECNIKVLIVDTLAKGMRGDENSSKDVGAVMRNFDRLRQAMGGGTVVYLHHLRKPNENIDADIDDDIRGSSALSGFYDVHHAMRRKSLNQDWLDLTVRQSNGAERYFKLWWDISRSDAQATLRAEEYDPNEVSPETIANCLALLLPGMDYSGSALATAWKIPPEMINVVKTALLDAGTLVKRSRGKYRLCEAKPETKEEKDEKAKKEV